MAAEQTKISVLEHHKIPYGKMDADDFRDYILGFIFYKYLSTKMDLYANNTYNPTV
jgi:type I restriction-modification system DNA methylase subunit